MGRVSGFRSLASVLIAAAAAVSMAGQEQGIVSFNSFEPVDFEPSVAWRTVAASDGSIFMAHQRATSATIDIAQPTDGFSSPYGGGGDGSCTGIVQSGVTRVTSTGLVGTAPQLDGLVLPVDIAISPERDWMAIATAGDSGGRSRPELYFEIRKGSTPLNPHQWIRKPLPRG